MKTQQTAALVAVMITLVAAAAATATGAHPELEARIAAATTRIAAGHASAQHYFERGGLYRQHEAWDAALADFERTLALDPAMDDAMLGKARVLLRGGWPHSAKAVADAYLVDHPGDAIALLTRGRAKAATGQPLAGAADLAHAAAVIKAPKPDLAIERAVMLAAAGPAHLGEALHILDDAINTFGPLVTLELAAINLEADAGKLDAALARLDALTNRMPRRESYLVMRAKLLEAAGRTEAAARALADARTAIEALPDRIRKTRAVQTLEAEIAAALARLAGTSNDHHPGDQP
jgi:tetratricopeptide (TPR) repeat protein